MTDAVGVDRCQGGWIFVVLHAGRFERADFFAEFETGVNAMGDAKAILALEADSSSSSTCARRAVPADDGLRRHEDEHISPTRPVPCKRRPEATIVIAERWTARTGTDG